ncbi:helix-turn-helix domain-containing protein [Paenibacillus pasadenensis]|uniref:helix-turn-helix domain-containing protein n=1 Tax=Paenibacillus pasadenensis TaxID=217090 RepID=UPI002041DA5E|nr:helix-turn-helix domain-containing protein [Paenibacillus pasadenensis]MCM3748525.1 helix-turn-helix domain-containing protein [Paenibacillus pasadenensis]
MSSIGAAPPPGTMFGFPLRIHKLEDGVAGGLAGNSSSSLLIVVWEGRLNGLTLEGMLDGPLELSPGELLLLPPGSDVRLEAGRAAAGILLELELHGGTESTQNRLRPIRADKETISAAKSLAFGWSASRQQPWQLQALFIELMKQIHHDLQRREAEPESWMEDSLLYIHSQYWDDMSRDRLAERAGVSPEHFSRCFRKRTGASLTDYLTLLRVRKVQEKILSGHSGTLDQLARQVGYSDGLYLSRKFKQLTGTAPSRYNKTVLRPAALNVNHSASLWALGIRPEWGIFSEWFVRTHGARPVRNAQMLLGGREALEPEVEPPDVILSYESENPEHRLLELGPVVQLPHRRISWQDQFRLIADMTDRRSYAEKLLSRIGEKSERLRERLGQRYGEGRTAIIWEIGRNKAYAICASNGRGAQLLYGDLGFRMPLRMLDTEWEQKGYVEAALEELPLYDADFVFVTGAPGSIESAERWERMMRSEPWLAMKAAAEGRVHMLDSSELFFGYDPLSSEAQLHKLEEVLLFKPAAP